jgi:hypothetical protein
VFLLLSLLASAIQEAIAAALALRSATLEQGLRNMLEQDSALPPGVAYPQPTEPARRLVDDLYGHPLVRTMYRQSWWPVGRSSAPTGAANVRLPSYISPRSFALALIDTVAPAAAGTNADGTPRSNADVIADLRAAIDGLEVLPGVKHRLLRLLDDARGEIDDFRLGLEAWFDDTMARVSGWYKRKTQLILAVLALLITLALNANALTISDRLWHNPEVRAAVVQQATSPAVTGATAGNSPQEKLNNAANNVDSVEKLGVPIGWSSDAKDVRHVSFTSFTGATTALGGWLLTIFAISLGAPFWFDTLSRLSRLRSSGKPETPLPASGRGQLDERVRPQR